MSSTTTRLEQIEAEIKTADCQSHNGLWQIGKLLTEAKSLCKHGEWELFLSGRFGWSVSYAARLMRLYSEYGEGLPAGIGISTLLVTLTLEESVRTKLNEVISAAELSRAEAELLKQKYLADSRSLDEARARVESGPEIEKLKTELRAELEAEVRTSAEARVSTCPEPAAEELADLQADLAELDKTNKDLQKQLSAALKSKSAAESAASETARLRANLETVNSELIAARESASAARAAADLAEAARVAAETNPANIKTVKVEVPVVPADYESLKEDHCKLSGLVALLQADLTAAQSKPADPAFAVATLLDELTAARARIAELEEGILKAGKQGFHRSGGEKYLERFYVEIRRRTEPNFLVHKYPKAA